MELAALRRAFRARPTSAGCTEFVIFLEKLGESELAWRRFVSILEKDVIPVVSRHHPGADGDEIASTCFAGVFETWGEEWLDRIHGAERIRRLLESGRHVEAFVELTKHPRYRGTRGERAKLLWSSRRPFDAVDFVEGSQSARSFFIAKTRSLVGESQRKQRRQSFLMSQNCYDMLGLPGSGGGQALATPDARSLCGAELDDTPGEGSTWRISALPPAQLLSQEMADRIRRMLGAIEELGPEHSRVFKLLLEGLSQQNIAKVEGRHPAAISRRVQNLRDLCRMQLLES